MFSKSSWYKWSAVGALGAITLLFTHCGKPFSEKGDLVWDESGVSVSLAGTSSASSLQAFEQTLYPITRARCASCHGSTQQPLHASSNSTTAHNSVINSYKVDFANIPNSRMVQKLREGHNCWGSCTANAMEMQLAIEDWKDLMAVTSPAPGATTGTTSGGMPNPGNYTKSTANSMTLQLERQGVYNQSMPLVSQAAAATITGGGGTIARVAGTPTYIHIPNANAQAVGGSDTVNVAAFTFSSPAARNNGALWALVNAKAPSDDSFNVKLNNGNFFTFDIADTANQFVWVRMPNNHNFTAGLNTVRISNREDGAKIASILFTTNQSFNPGGMGMTAGAVTLSYPLNGLGIAGARVEMRVEDYDAYSYKISQLRIISPNVSVQVKGVYLIMNGTFNPQNANLTQVDEMVAASANGTVLTPSSMIVLKGAGGEAVDTFGLGFEILQ